MRYLCFILSLLPSVAKCACGQDSTPLSFSTCGTTCTSGEHAYTLTPFQKVMQTGEHGDHLCGTYTEPATSGATVVGGSETSAVHYYNDQGASSGCPSGNTGRMSTVNYACGATRKILDVKESGTCKYVIEVRTPSCCTSAPTGLPTGTPMQGPTHLPSHSHTPTKMPSPPPENGSCHQNPQSFKGQKVGNSKFNAELVIGESVTCQSGRDCGNYNSTSAMGHTTTQIYNNGEFGIGCETPPIPYGRRESIIQFQCGLTRQITDLVETARCLYLITLQMPACCTSSEWDKILANPPSFSPVTPQPSLQPASITQKAPEVYNHPVVNIYMEEKKDKNDLNGWVFFPVFLLVICFCCIVHMDKN